MKLTPVSGPAAIQAQTNTNTGDARARAIAALTGTATQAQSQNPTPTNANAIAPEDLSAVQAPKVETQSTETIDKSAINETTEVPAPAQAEEDKPLSEKYQLLARKERAIRAQAQKQQQELAQKQQALDKRQAELDAKEQEYKSGYISKQRLKEQTLDVLAENELTYDELTQKYISRQNADPGVMSYIKNLEAKISNLEKGQEDQKASVSQQQDEQYKAAVNQITRDVKATVDSDPNFETIKAANAVKDVVDLIERTFKEDGVLLSNEEAAQLVEEELIERGLKFARLNKIQSRLKPAVIKQTQAPVEQPQTKQQQPMKTLTNAAGSTRQLSAKERAILAFKGELKD